MERDTSDATPNDSVNYYTRGKLFIFVCAGFYGAYSLIYLIETLDFLAMLHSKPPEYHATYTLVNVIYYFVEMVVCGLLCFAHILLPVLTKAYKNVVATALVIVIFRIILVYYLYVFMTPEYRWVPYIYKEANAFSVFFRMTFIPAQLIFGLIVAGFWYKFRNKIEEDIS